MNLSDLWFLVSLKRFLSKQINLCLEQLILTLIWEVYQEGVAREFVFEGREGNMCGLLKFCFVLVCSFPEYQ